jgi:hypothetical protein
VRIFTARSSRVAISLARQGVSNEAIMTSTCWTRKLPERSACPLAIMGLEVVFREKFCFYAPFWRSYKTKKRPRRNGQGSLLYSYFQRSTSCVESLFLLGDLLVFDVLIIGHKLVNKPVRSDLNDPVGYSLGEFMVMGRK